MILLHVRGGKEWKCFFVSEKEGGGGVSWDERKELDGMMGEGARKQHLAHRLTCLVARTARVSKRGWIFV